MAVTTASRAAAITPASPSGNVLQESPLQNGHVLVAPAGAADENSRAGMSSRIAPRAEKSVGSFDGRQDAFEPGAFGEGIQRFAVHRRLVLDAAAPHQV